jgi:hypothetical protein
MQETTRTNSEDDRVENVESSLQDTPYIHANIYTGSVAPSPTRLKSAPVAVVAVVAADVVAAAIATDIAAVPNSCNPVRSGLPRTASRIRLRRSEAPPSQADHNELRGVGRIPAVNASLELFYDTFVHYGPDREHRLDPQRLKTSSHQAGDRRRLKSAQYVVVPEETPDADHTGYGQIRDRTGDTFLCYSP